MYKNQSYDREVVLPEPSIAFDVLMDFYTSEDSVSELFIGLASILTAYIAEYISNICYAHGGSSSYEPIRGGGSTAYFISYSIRLTIA